MEVDSDSNAKDNVPMDIWSIIMEMSDSSTRLNLGRTCREMWSLHQLITVPRLIFNFQYLNEHPNEFDRIAQIESVFDRAREIHLADYGGDNLAYLEARGLLPLNESVRNQGPRIWKARRCRLLSIDTSEGIPFDVTSIVVPQLIELQMFLGTNSVEFLRRLQTSAGKKLSQVPTLRIFPTRNSYEMASELPDCQCLLISGNLQSNRKFLQSYLNDKRSTQMVSFHVSHSQDRDLDPQDDFSQLSQIKAFQCNSHVTFREYIASLQSVQDLQLRDCNLLDSELKLIPPVKILNVSGNGGLENAHCIPKGVWTSLEDFSMAGNVSHFVSTSIECLAQSPSLRRLELDLTFETLTIFEKVFGCPGIEIIDVHIESFAFAKQDSLLQLFQKITRRFRTIVIHLSHTQKLHTWFQNCLASILATKCSSLYIL